MRTTLDLPDDLMRQTKVAAAEQGIKLREYIQRSLEQSLRNRLAEDDGASHPRPRIITIAPGNRRTTLVNQDDAVFGPIDDC